MHAENSLLVTVDVSFRGKMGVVKRGRLGTVSGAFGQFLFCLQELSSIASLFHIPSKSVGSSGDGW